MPACHLDSAWWAQEGPVGQWPTFLVEEAPEVLPKTEALS